MNSWLLKNLSMNDGLDVGSRIAVASQGMQKLLAASLFNGPDPRSFIMCKWCSFSIIIWMENQRSST